MLARAGALLGSAFLHRAAAVSCLPSTSYATSAASSSQSDSSVSEQTRQSTVNKLLYRSKQRGFLELDLLMGLWAETHIPKMTMKELHQMSQVLDEENPDLFKWLTGQLQPPERLTSNSVFEAIRSHVAQQLHDSAPLKARAEAGRDWVRGWDDGWRQGGKESADKSKQ